MKPTRLKSKSIILSVAFAAAVASCQNHDDEWITGAEESSGRTRDTVTNGHTYRHFGGMWYPVIGGLISPSSYRGAPYNQISRPGYVPAHTGRSSRFGTRSGGFGRSSSGHAAHGG